MGHLQTGPTPDSGYKVIEFSYTENKQCSETIEACENLFLPSEFNTFFANRITCCFHTHTKTTHVYYRLEIQKNVK